MTHPHDPYAIAQPYWDRYQDREIDMPALSGSAVPEDPHSRRLRHVIGLEQHTPTDGAGPRRPARLPGLGFVRG